MAFPDALLACEDHVTEHLAGGNVFQMVSLGVFVFLGETKVNQNELGMWPIFSHDIIWLYILMYVTFFVKLLQSVCNLYTDLCGAVDTELPLIGTKSIPESLSKKLRDDCKLLSSTIL